MAEPKLGDLVRDIVSNFEGIALAKSICLYEATQFRVHPITLDDRGVIIPEQWIEAARLQVIKTKKATGFLQIAGSHAESE